MTECSNEGQSSIGIQVGPSTHTCFANHVAKKIWLELRRAAASIYVLGSLITRYKTRAETVLGTRRICSSSIYLNLWALMDIPQKSEVVKSAPQLS